MHTSPDLLSTALAYYRAGLVVLPNDPRLKYPKGVEAWQTVIPDEAWIARQRWRAIGVRDVEGIDLDNKGAPDAATLYAEWRELVESLAPGLVERLLMEQTPSGGYHLVWHCAVMGGNQKLATRPPTAAELAASPQARETTLIETRGTGGQFQVAPSPGYTLIRGSWEALPTIDAAERQILLDCARALTRRPRRSETGASEQGDRPGDAYNRDGAEHALGALRAAGWRVAYQKGEAQYLTRPGKPHGVSATFGYVAPGVLYVFSSSASPFAPETGYSPFAIYAHLQHGGDWKAAAGALRAQGYGKPRVEAPPPSRDWTAPVPEVEDALAPSRYVDPLDVNDLLAMERRPPIWYIPGFLREGFGMLVGQPNVGKTPLVIQAAIAMATGGLFLNAVPCRRARVLFLGTEYTRQELIPLVDESRLCKAIERGWLAFKTVDDDDLSPRTADEAIGMLEYFVAQQGYNVIILDVLTGYLPTEGFKQNIYRGDYGEFKPYHRLGLHYNAAILGTWHASKREADPRLMYNGSTGMWAVPASRMSMYVDSEQRPRLFSMPRFCEKVDWQLAQEKTLAGRRWVLADAAPEPAMGPQEMTIYRWLREQATKETPKTPATIAEMVGLPGNTVRTVVGRMFDKNLVQRSGSGYYIERVADVADVADVALSKDTPIESATYVAQMLRADPALGRGETGAQHPQHDSTRNPPQHGATPPVFDTVINEKALRNAGYKWLNLADRWYGYTTGKDTYGPVETRADVMAWLWAHYQGASA